MVKFWFMGKKSATASTQWFAHPRSNIATTEGLFGLRWHNMPREGERGKEKKGAQIWRHFNTFQCDIDNQLYCTSLANGKGHLLTYTCLLETNIYLLIKTVNLLWGQIRNYETYRKSHFGIRFSTVTVTNTRYF